MSQDLAILEAELIDLQIEQLKYRSMLSDTATGLPSIPLILEDLKAILENGCRLGIIGIDIARFSNIEKIYGWQLFDELLLKISQLLQKAIKKINLQEAIIAISRTRDDVFFVFLPLKMNEKLEDLNNIGKQIQNYLEIHSKQTITQQLEHTYGFCIGYELISYNPNVRSERQIYHG